VPQLRLSPAQPHACTKAIAALLAIALLFAQWSGLAHSIVHAGWQNAPFASVGPDRLASLGPDRLASVGKGKADLHHSCQAFEAATIAATIHTTPLLVPALPSAQVLALWRAFASWDAPHHCNFLSRAPPVFRLPL
jgi:hypothetical protein